MWIAITSWSATLSYPVTSKNAICIGWRHVRTICFIFQLFNISPVHEFNNARLSSGRPVLHISRNNYGHPRFEAFLKTTRYQEFRTRTEHLSAASSPSRSQPITSTTTEEADVEMGSESGPASAVEEYVADAESDVTMNGDQKDKGELVS